MNTTKTLDDCLLTAFMSYVPEEGIVFERFVEHGSSLVQLHDPVQIQEVLLLASNKAHQLRLTNPKLARQLTFLVELFACSWAQLPEKTRSEMAFALLYTARDLDLIPDSIPGCGFADDAAVVEAVLTRHEEVLLEHCLNYGYRWEALRP